MERARKRNHPGYLEWVCQLLANDQADLRDIFNHYSSVFIRHSKTFEQIVYERDRTKVRTKPEVIWIFGDLFSGKTTCANNSLQSKYDSVKNVEKYYVGLAGYRNVLFDEINKTINFTDLLDIFSHKHLELPIKHGFFCFLPEKVCVTSLLHPVVFYNSYKKTLPSDDFLSKTHKIFQCSYHPHTAMYITTHPNFIQAYKSFFLFLCIEVFFLFLY
jgi:hypothetical protein